MDIDINKIMKMFNSGYNLSIICRVNDISYHTVYKAIRDSGVTLPKGLPTKNDLMAAFSYYAGTGVACYRYGKTSKQMATYRFNLRRKYGQITEELKLLWPKWSGRKD